MSKYELVLVLDPKLTKKNSEELLGTIEKIFDGKMIEKDEIGVLDLAVEIKGNNKANFFSYYLELSEEIIQNLKKELRLMKGVIRYNIYKMGSKEKFLKFKEINKMFEITQEEKQLQENDKAFQDMDTISKIKK